MEDFRLVLAVLAAIAIIAVLVHGFWSIRRQQPKPLKDNPMTGFSREQMSRRDPEGFDSDGIGEVRVRKVSPDDKPPRLKTAKMRRHEPQPPRQVTPPPAQFDEEEEDDFTLAPQESVAKRVPRQPMVAEPAPAPQAAPQMELRLPESDDSAEDDVLPEPRDVLVLHVVAREGKTLSGAELLPSLLTLNFKYGDMQIFHRHEDPAGQGRVLFSLANMVKPGVFDPDNMEQFTTHGVVLFMTLPCHGDALMNFSVMLNSAHQLADDLDGLLLDGERNPWQQLTKQAYLERIRHHG